MPCHKRHVLMCLILDFIHVISGCLVPCLPSLFSLPLFFYSPFSFPLLYPPLYSHWPLPTITPNIPIIPTTYPTSTIPKNEAGDYTAFLQGIIWSLSCRDGHFG
ncbi:hypothetical protein BDQ17DRAFT_813137 [Cyathus striatus]|nr:hypothetical protein BDQ17DRAFT_813137 [Cyathus striatus]